MISSNQRSAQESVTKECLRKMDFKIVLFVLACVMGQALGEFLAVVLYILCNIYQG